MLEYKRTKYRCGEVLRGAERSIKKDLYTKYRIEGQDTVLEHKNLTASHLKIWRQFLGLSHQKLHSKPAGNWPDYFLVPIFGANLRVASHAVWNENIWRGGPNHT